MLMLLITLKLILTLIGLRRHSLCDARGMSADKTFRSEFDKHPFLHDGIPFKPSILFAALFMAAGAEINAHYAKNLDDEMMHKENTIKEMLAEEARVLPAGSNHAIVRHVSSTVSSLLTSSQRFRAALRQYHQVSLSLPLPSLPPSLPPCLPPSIPPSLPLSLPP